MDVARGVQGRNVTSRALLRARRVAKQMLIGSDHPAWHHWVRVVHYREILEFLSTLPTAKLSCAEISGDWLEHKVPWATHRTLAYPEFDLTAPGDVTDRYDVVVCDQVLEHVGDPLTASRTLRDLCKPGGHVIVATPFLLRIHPDPVDHWRFTPSGLRILLEGAGLDVEQVRAWGNAACIRANFRRWAYHLPWRSLRNDPDLPVTVCAFARRPRPCGGWIPTGG